MNHASWICSGQGLGYLTTYRCRLLISKTRTVRQSLRMHACVRRSFV